MSIEESEGATFDVIKHDLARFIPLRIVLTKVDDVWNGVTENSFSMDKSQTHVRIWWSGKAYSMLGEHIVDGIYDAEFQKADGVVYDPLSDDCPVEVDWNAWRKATTKYYQRNAPFKVKG